MTIDYQSFSSVLIELLNECHLEESRDHPSKRLELSIETLRSTLSIVEPRRIRNITELKLFFTPADDAQQKAYLGMFSLYEVSIIDCSLLSMYTVNHLPDAMH